MAQLETKRTEQGQVQIKLDNRLDGEVKLFAEVAGSTVILCDSRFGKQQSVTVSLDTLKDLVETIEANQ